MHYVVFAGIAIFLYVAWYVGGRLSVGEARKQAPRDGQLKREFLVDAKSRPRLNGEPRIDSITGVTLETRVTVPAGRTDLIAALENEGALIKDMWVGEDRDRVAKLDRVTPSLLHELSPMPMERLVLSAFLTDDNGSSMTYAHGTYESVRRQLQEFVARPVGRYDISQERGDFATGQYVVAGALLCATGDYSSAVCIGAISLTDLQARLDHELERLRALLS